jgi:hypothetical protein
MKMRVKALIIYTAVIVSLTANVLPLPALALIRGQQGVAIQNPCCQGNWYVGHQFTGNPLQVTPYLSSTDPSGQFACAGFGSIGSSTASNYSCSYGSFYGPSASNDCQTMYQNAQPFQVNWIYGTDYYVYN